MTSSTSAFWRAVRVPKLDQIRALLWLWDFFLGHESPRPVFEQVVLATVQPLGPISYCSLGQSCLEDREQAESSSLHEPRCKLRK